MAENTVKPVIGTGLKIFANDDNQFVIQFLNEDYDVVAETKFSCNMSDVVLAYMMYAQGQALGLHPKSEWIH
jgi:hypothetical protein